MTDTLLNTFLRALKGRKFAECQAVLATVRSTPGEQAAALALYFAGLLANEAERDAAKAERLFLALLEQTIAPDLRAHTLRALGIAYEYQNQSSQSIATFQQLLAIYATLEQPLEQAKTLKNIAIACENGYARGDLDDAHLLYGEQCCQQALAILAQFDDSFDSPALAWERSTTWNSLGALYLHLERWEDAIVCYQRHAAYAASHDDDFSLAIAKLNLGEIYQLQGSATWAQAATLYTEALTLFQQLDEPYEIVGGLLNLGSLYQQLGRPAAALVAYQQAIALAEQLRAGVTSEAGRAGYFATVETLYTNAILLCIEQGQPEQAFDLTEQARARAFLDRLALRADEFAPNLAEPVITLRQVQASLPADALLLAYFTTGLLDAQADGRGKQTRPSPVGNPGTHQRHRFPPAKTLLFAITKHTLQVHDLDLLPNLLRPNHLENVVERHFLSRPLLRTLYQKLIEPVEALLLTQRQLYLLPHGPLHYVPFQALVAADGAPLVRANGPTFTHAPNATTLFSAQTSPKPAANLFAIGYNAATPHPLRYAEAEAQQVAHLCAGISLVGAGTKKAALYAQASQVRLLHFSCHGEFIAADPLASFLLIGNQEQLTAQEIVVQLHLKCDLVTLSACESGLSHIRRGDEMMGLLRAFFYAGAQALLASLWRVDEQATYLLMQHFYAQIQAGRDFSTALQTAQLYLRNLTYAEAQRILAASEQMSTLPNAPIAMAAPPTDDAKVFADPRYWAPFVLFSRAGGARPLWT